jgi:monomeric sarcosine oxidase
VLFAEQFRGVIITNGDDSLDAVDADVVIVGAGLAGAATAWALAQRGRSVVLLEQFAPGHSAGSSHGSARIVRRAYGDGLYTRMTGRAFELWREVEQASGAQILRMHGGLDFGPRRNVPAVAEHLAAAGVPYELLPADEAARRWPGMEFEGEVVHHAQAGTMDAALAVSTMIELSGADVRYETPAVSVSPQGQVGLADGTSLCAETVVVSAGAWLAPLLGDVVPLPPLQVTQQQIFHFPRLDPSLPPWPSVIHEGTDAAVYHLAGGRDGGPDDDRKIGEHDGGSDCTAADRTGVVDPDSRTRVIEYVRRWLPGLSPVPRGEASCLYTETPREDFILDRIGPVVVCSPCSGHGAKFAPLIGELVADLVHNAHAEVPSRFRLAHHLEGRVGSVSL